jgi:hypothetical protein
MAVAQVGFSTVLRGGAARSWGWGWGWQREGRLPAALVLVWLGGGQGRDIHTMWVERTQEPARNLSPGTGPVL